MSEAAIVDAPTKPAPDASARLRRMMSTGRWRAYSGANRESGQLKLWKPELRPVDGEIHADGPDLRARARALHRNHPFAKQAVAASRLGVIGRRLRYSCQPDHQFLGIDEEEAIRWATQFERIWESYAHSRHCYVHAGKRLNFTGLMALAHDSEFVDGEALLVLKWDPERRWNTCVQPIDVDRLSMPNGRVETAYLKGGIELDAFGAPTAYHIRAAHPADRVVFDGSRDQWVRVDRETDFGRAIVLHSFDHHRPEQTRGVTEMAAVIEDMKMGAEYASTALQAAILQASFAAVLQSEANYKEAMEAILASPEDEIGKGTLVELARENLEAAQAYHDEAAVTFNGARVSKLYPGEELKLLTPGGTTASLGDFQSYATKSYAAGMGVNPIAVSQDYSGVNYSSAKMAEATTHRAYANRRERLAHKIGLPMVAAVLQELVFSGSFDLPKGLSPADYFEAEDALIKGRFLSQGAPNLEPLKEAQAQKERLQMGLDTLEEIAAAEGKDWREVVAQRSREKTVLQAAGLGEPDYSSLLGEPSPEAEDAPAEEGGDDPAETPAIDAPSKGEAHVRDQARRLRPDGGAGRRSGGSRRGRGSGAGLQRLDGRSGAWRRVPARPT